MKRPKSKVLFVVISRLTVLVLLVSLFVCLPLFGYMYSNRELLEKKFMGGKAAYQGIITLWNVDTFEGGSSSRSGFLSSVAELFERENRGAFIKVENITIDEMNANIKAGILPSLFCYGGKLGGVLKDKMVAIDALAKGVEPNFLSSGLSGGRLLAAAWAAGGYCLLSTPEKLAAANGEGSLKDIALELAFDKQLKKKVKHTYSLTFGGNQYASAMNIFSRAFMRGTDELIKSGALDKNISQTSYEAYSSFVSGNATVLLGTQRDIFRMENRVNAGKESGVIVEPFKEYTDLVVYISSLCAEGDKGKVCSDFIEFLLSPNIQQRLKNIGLLSTTGQSLYNSGNMKLLEDAITENTMIENIF